MCCYLQTAAIQNKNIFLNGEFVQNSYWLPMNSKRTTMNEAQTLAFFRIRQHANAEILFIAFQLRFYALPRGTPWTQYSPLPFWMLVTHRFDVTWLTEKDLRTIVDDIYIIIQPFLPHGIVHCIETSCIWDTNFWTRCQHFSCHGPVLFPKICANQPQNKYCQCEPVHNACEVVSHP